MNLDELKKHCSELRARYDVINEDISELDKSKNLLSLERKKIIPQLSQLEEAIRKYEDAVEAIENSGKDK
jgi:prefoldin subunit 5